MIKKISLFLFVLALASPIIAYKWVDTYFHFAKNLSTEKSIIIPKGASLNKISLILAENNIIEYPQVFKLYVKYLKDYNSLKAGEYEIPQNVSPADVYDMLSKGKVILHKITFPEGITSHQIMQVLMLEDKLTGEISRSLKEGIYLPDTYNFTRDDKKQNVLNRMQKSMIDFLDKNWEKRDKTIPIKTKKEAIILASIVEKETGVASERGRIAAVFVNRLRKGMKLQSDPTTIYGITKGEGSLGRKLLYKDLRAKTPYNTYTIKGLPPTPIANPSREAIKAVLNPPPIDDIFFVADGTGGHVFAKTLKEHNVNVKAWRKIRNKLYTK